MATADVPSRFIADTPASADEVNLNFDAILDFLNNELPHLDGSKVMTGILSLPARDPVSDDQAARKKYVDDKAAAVAAAEAKSRVQWGGTSSPIQGILPANPQIIVKAGRNAGITSLAGNIKVNYPTPFPNGTLTIQTQSLYFADADLMAVKTVEGMNNSGFTLAYSQRATSRQPYGGRGVDFTWLALGF